MNNAGASFDGSKAVTETRKGFSREMSVSQKTLAEWEKMRAAGLDVAIRFKPKAARVSLPPFYSEDELYSGVSFQVTGADVDPQFQTPVIICNDLDMDMQRTLYCGYNLAGALSFPRDKDKLFFVQLEGGVPTRKGFTVKRYSVMELEPREE